MKRLLLLFLLLPLAAAAQPRLVVGIVVDQMRWDYLVRYADRYEKGGFRRLWREGYSADRTFINYLPTVTAVGHTSVYTGSVPALHGIVGNDFPVDGRWGTSVGDTTVHTVGAGHRAGQASPRRLLATTLPDQLRLATNFQSRTIGIAIKDRAAILPAGHSATAAYWLDIPTGRFITSSYYMDALPEWLERFNNQALASQYMSRPWTLLHPADTYLQSAPTGQPYEAPVGRDIKTSPCGNTLTLDLARAVIDGERLGHNPTGATDFLAISLSSTDAIGHAVGPNSAWTEDTYLRLDHDLARLLRHLDKTVGRKQYILFLTADHGAAHNVCFRQQHRLPAATWPYFRVLKALNDTLSQHYGAPLILNMENENVYLDHDAIRRVRPRDAAPEAFLHEVESAVCRLLEGRKEVAYCFPFHHLPDYLPDALRVRVRNAYCPTRSGDLQIILAAGVTEDWDDGYAPHYDGLPRGTNHAVWSPDDSHIPFLVVGPHIKARHDTQTHHITDIAPTIAALLRIQPPSAAIGDAIGLE